MALKGIRLQGRNRKIRRKILAWSKLRFASRRFGKPLATCRIKISMQAVQRQQTIAPNLGAAMFTWATATGLTRPRGV
jgi:hypothetical protein